VYRDLEKAVEDLSELLESPIEAENIPTLRQKVTDKTVCRFLVPFGLTSQLHCSIYALRDMLVVFSLPKLIPIRAGLCPEAQRDCP